MTTRPTPDQFADASWDDIFPLYDELATRPLHNTQDIEQWLDDWNALDEAVFEASNRAYVANSCDSENQEKEAAVLRFISDIEPRREEQVVRLVNRLLGSGYSRPDLEEVLRRFRTDHALFREENIPIKQELAGLANQYNKICGSMTAEWHGREIPLDQLNPFMEHPDRAIREEAWRKSMQPYLDHRDEFADIMDRMIELRQQLAHNAGYANFRDYMFAELHRFAYSPDDCLAFHDGIEDAFMPLVTRLRQERQRTLGVGSLRPWDLSGDPYGRPPLTPFTTTDELVNTCQHILGQVDPVFGERFRVMDESRLLDLDSRTGKHPGGYCTRFAWSDQPFIFMNASGINGDVSVLLHEAGHAMHTDESAGLPFLHQQHYGSEIAEVASMSMQLMTSGYLGKDAGGFYSPDDSVRARRELLVDETSALGLVAAGDAFQHWLYTDPAGADRDARAAKWVELETRFNPQLDWTGIEEFRRGRWYRILHFFEVPFYFIEYGIAWLGALQLWRNYLAAPRSATTAYRAALALGGSRPLDELYRTAGIELVFDAGRMRELAGTTEQHLSSLDTSEPQDARA